MSHKVALVAAIVLGLYTLTTILMKLIWLRRATLQSSAFAGQVAECLRDPKNLTEAIEICVRYRQSHLAQVVVAGLSEFLSQRKNGIAADEALQLAERLMNRERERIRGELDRGTLSWKLTSASSPLLALFFSASAAIIVGAVVVVPAVWMSIYAESRHNDFDINMKNAASEMVDYLQTRLPSERQARS